VFTAEELRAIPLFSELAGKELDHLSRASADLRLIAGEYVIHEGDTRRVLFFLVEGMVEATKWSTARSAWWAFEEWAKSLVRFRSCSIRRPSSASAPRSRRASCGSRPRTFRLSLLPRRRCRMRCVRARRDASEAFKRSRRHARRRA
jgi:hypothetical protein